MDIQSNILKLLIKYPFYGKILSQMKIENSNNIDKIKIDVYPTFKIIFNIKWYQGLSIIEQNAYLIHELLHIILKHPFRREDRNSSLWSISSDLVVNQFLSEELTLSNSITIEKFENEFNITIPKNQSSEYYYDFLLNYELELELTKNKKEGLIKFKNSNILNFDIIEDIKHSDYELILINKQIKDNIKELNNSLSYNSKLLKSINENYKAETLNWRVILKRYLSKQGKSLIKKSYKRISRRFDNYPGRLSVNGFEALIALDESGSMNNKNLELCINEIKQINKITKAKISVTRFDSECSEPIKLDEFVKNDRRIKKGSTDFRPVFLLADKLKIRTVILFTDGDGIVPETVNQRVLWLLTNNGYNRSNFGESINFISEV